MSDEISFHPAGGDPMTDAALAKIDDAKAAFAAELRKLLRDALPEIDRQANVLTVAIGFLDRITAIVQQCASPAASAPASDTPADAAGGCSGSTCQITQAIESFRSTAPQLIGSVRGILAGIRGLAG